VFAGDDAPNPWQLPRSREIDPSDPRVRMGRTQDRCEADSRNWREIVDKARLPGQERRIFLALNGRADPSLRHGPDCFQQNAVHLGKALTSPLLAVSSRCMIYRTSRVVATRLTTSKIICRYRGAPSRRRPSRPQDQHQYLRRE